MVATRRLSNSIWALVIIIAMTMHPISTVDIYSDQANLEETRIRFSAATAIEEADNLLKTILDPMELGLGNPDVGTTIPDESEEQVSPQAGTRRIELLTETPAVRRYWDPANVWLAS